MPTTRKETKQAVQPVKSPVKAKTKSGRNAVANVNKNGGSKKTGATSKRKANSAPPVPTDLPEKQARRKTNDMTNTSQVTNSPDPDRLIAYGYEKPTTVNFEEGDETVTMLVQDNDDSYAQSEDEEVDYEDDNEVSFKDDNYESQSESKLEGEIKSHAQDLGRPREEVMLPHPQRLDQVDEAECNSEIRKLDLEMKEKLVQMRKIMRQGGLTESAAEVDKSIRDLQSHTSGDRGKYHHFHQRSKSANTNTNSNKNRRGVIKHRQFKSQGEQVLDMANNLLTTLSEETLYKSAVPKKSRDSSSSEDVDIDLVNTSDETMNENFSNLEITDNILPTGVCTKDTDQLTWLILLLAEGRDTGVPMIHSQTMSTEGTMPDMQYLQLEKLHLKSKHNTC